MNSACPADRSKIPGACRYFRIRTPGKQCAGMSKCRRPGTDNGHKRAQINVFSLPRVFTNFYFVYLNKRQLIQFLCGMGPWICDWRLAITVDATACLDRATKSTRLNVSQSTWTPESTRVSQSTVDRCLHALHTRQYINQVGHVSEDHSGHGGIVTPQRIEHSVGRHQRKRSVTSDVEPQIGATEEEARMTGTVFSQLDISHPFRCLRIAEQLVNIVVMPGNTLTAVTQFSTLLKPLPQTMKDHDLVPEGALGLNGHHIRYTQIEIRQIVCNVGTDGRYCMRVQC
ncbi:MAG: hypothetical protein GAK33_03920 [Burkholderia lata]|uniref:Uncharacterized protein n=1 Tax=Burkholderia lata (strain ATCC 17760 / DSM 23089 / LMG 22485 / NCIMB 9086 / R18194 / 383) TaxID=482957 RepID=A0A833UZY1_BURL3|nr:MAG: hypothetical protein GAK33_03920 [Burkholderia lata]